MFGSNNTFDPNTDVPDLSGKVSLPYLSSNIENLRLTAGPGLRRDWR